MEWTKILVSRYYFVKSIYRLLGKWLTLLITDCYFNLLFTRSYGATYLIQHVLKMAAQIKVPLRNKVIVQVMKRLVSIELMGGNRWPFLYRTGLNPRSKWTVKLIHMLTQI